MFQTILRWGSSVYSWFFVDTYGQARKNLKDSAVSGRLLYEPALWWHTSSSFTKGIIWLAVIAFPIVLSVLFVSLILPVVLIGCGSVFLMFLNYESNIIENELNNPKNKEQSSLSLDFFSNIWSSITNLFQPKEAASEEATLTTKLPENKKTPKQKKDSSLQLGVKVDRGSQAIAKSRSVRTSIARYLGTLQNQAAVENTEKSFEALRQEVSLPSIEKNESLEAALPLPQIMPQTINTLTSPSIIEPSLCNTLQLSKQSASVQLQSRIPVSFGSREDANDFSSDNIARTASGLSTQGTVSRDLPSSYLIPTRKQQSSINSFDNADKVLALTKLVHKRMIITLKSCNKSRLQALSQVSNSLNSLSKSVSIVSVAPRLDGAYLFKTNERKYMVCDLHCHSQKDLNHFFQANIDFIISLLAKVEDAGIEAVFNVHYTKSKKNEELLDIENSSTPVIENSEEPGNTNVLKSFNLDFGVQFSNIGVLGNLFNDGRCISLKLWKESNLQETHINVSVKAAQDNRELPVAAQELTNVLNVHLSALQELTQIADEFVDNSRILANQELSCERFDRCQNEEIDFWNVMGIIEKYQSNFTKFSADMPIAAFSEELEQRPNSYVWVFHVRTIGDLQAYCQANLVKILGLLEKIKEEKITVECRISVDNEAISNNEMLPSFSRVLSTIQSNVSPVNSKSPALLIDGQNKWQLLCDQSITSSSRYASSERTVLEASSNTSNPLSWALSIVGQEQIIERDTGDRGTQVILDRHQKQEVDITDISTLEQLSEIVAGCLDDDGDNYKELLAAQEPVEAKQQRLEQEEQEFEALMGMF